MTHVRLTAKTRKGKTRIHNSGAIWMRMDGAPDALTPKPVRTILIRSLDGRDWRWVHLDNDENFIVEVLN